MGSDVNYYGTIPFRDPVDSSYNYAYEWHVIPHDEMAGKDLIFNAVKLLRLAGSISTIHEPCWRSILLLPFLSNMPKYRNLWPSPAYRPTFLLARLCTE